MRGALLAVALSLAPVRAAAEPHALRVSWRDDADCPRPPTLEDEVDRLLGAPGPRGDDSYEVLVERSAASGYTLRLRVLGEQRAEREVELATCRDVSDAAALLIATAIDPEAALEVPREPADERAHREPEPPTDGSRVARARSDVSLLLGALGDLAALPRPSGGPSGGLSFQREGFRASLAARYLVPRSAEVEGYPARSEIGLLTGALALGYAFRLGGVELGPELEGELGRLTARTELVVRDGTEPVGTASTKHRLWADLLAGARLALWPDSRVGVDLGMFAAVPLVQWRLEGKRGAEERVAIYTPQRVSARIAIALRLSLGPRSGP